MQHPPAVTMACLAVACGVIATSPVLAFDGRYFREGIPECSDQVFTVSPVEVGLITNIDPLGALNPPGHTFPTDHLYFSSTSSGGRGPAIRAPGDVYLLEVTGPEDLSRPADFKMSFALL